MFVGIFIAKRIQSHDLHAQNLRASSDIETQCCVCVFRLQYFAMCLKLVRFFRSVISHPRFFLESLVHACARTILPALITTILTCFSYFNYVSRNTYLLVLWPANNKLQTLWPPSYYHRRGWFINFQVLLLLFYRVDVGHVLCRPICS